jgi:hypothetical protein
VLLDNALATMGAGLPSAMMSAMLYPERKVMAICGDGGFMMNSQEMETAVRLGLNLTVLILNDSSYGMIRWKQANMGFADFGLTYGNPDFVKYAESYGAKGHRVESAAHLKELLAHWPRYAGGPPDRLPGRLFGERPDPQQGHQGAVEGAVVPATPTPPASGRGKFVTTKLKDVYPLYLNNKAVQPNTDLAVTDKFTGEVAFRTGWRRRT